MNPESAAAPRVYEPAEPGVRYTLARNLDRATESAIGYCSLVRAKARLVELRAESSDWDAYRIFRITAVEVSE